MAGNTRPGRRLRPKTFGNPERGILSFTESSGNLMMPLQSETKGFRALRSASGAFRSPLDPSESTLSCLAFCKAMLINEPYIVKAFLNGTAPKESRGFGAPGKLSGGQFSAENGRQPRTDRKALWCARRRIPLSMNLFQLNLKNRKTPPVGCGRGWVRLLRPGRLTPPRSPRAWRGDPPRCLPAVPRRWGLPPGRRRERNPRRRAPCG